MWYDMYDMYDILPERNLQKKKEGVLRRGKRERFVSPMFFFLSLHGIASSEGVTV